MGGRLVSSLLAQGHRVRCLVRSPAKLTDVAWANDVEVVTGTLEGPLDTALADVQVAIYLVHSIGSGEDWVEKELRDAEHFRRSAEAAGVERIVYLGGMGRESAQLSVHLKSRHDVGRTLAAGPIPVCELRAAVVLGSGSTSFEMLRYLVEVLPVMVTPKWVATRCQPIAITDVLRYLVAAVNAPEPVAGVVEIGGPDVVTYAEMMEIYADEAGLTRRRLIPVPLLTPRLSSHWVGLVTPIPAALARPLVDSLVNEVVVRDSRAVDLFGAPEHTLREAIRWSLDRSTNADATSGADDGDQQLFRAQVADAHWAGGTILSDTWVATTTASAAAVFAAVTSLGGAAGWHRGAWLWRLRGLLDLVAGGPGLRRGRRHPRDLKVGDFVDFWRVESLEIDHRLRLHAEMVLPGDAWLEWVIEATDAQTTVTQRAVFAPRGLWGRAYWYGVSPFHRYIFSGLLSGVITHAAGRRPTRGERPRRAHRDPSRAPQHERPGAYAGSTVTASDYTTP